MLLAAPLASALLLCPSVPLPRATVACAIPDALQTLSLSDIRSTPPLELDELVEERGCLKAPAAAAAIPATPTARAATPANGGQVAHGEKEKLAVEVHAQGIEDEEALDALFASMYE